MFCFVVGGGAGFSQMHAAFRWDAAVGVDSYLAVIHGVIVFKGLKDRSWLGRIHPFGYRRDLYLNSV